MVCQENTILNDGSPISSGRLYFYDTNEAGSKASPEYRLGNRTEQYEYGFGAAPAIQESGGRRICYSSAQPGYYRRTRTDYLQNAAYVSAQTQIHSLPIRERIWEGSRQLTDVQYFYDTLEPSYYGEPVYQAAWCGSTRKAERGNLNQIARQIYRLDPAGNVSEGSTTESMGYDCTGNGSTVQTFQC